MIQLLVLDTMDTLRGGINPSNFFEKLLKKRLTDRPDCDIMIPETEGRETSKKP